MNAVTAGPDSLQKINARVRARFELDNQGEPGFVPDPEDAGLRHYHIVLNTDTPNPYDVDGVTYQLDKTYWDPQVVSTDRQHAFQAVITSYGDYEFSVKLQLSTRFFIERFRLSALLEATHGKDPNAAVKEALKRIKEN